MIVEVKGPFMGNFSPPPPECSSGLGFSAMLRGVCGKFC